MMKRSAALLLKSLYLDSSSPIYLAGETVIFNFIRENHPEASIGLDDVRAFLARQQVHSLHKPVRRIFPRVPIRSNYVDALWMADLVDMTKHSRANDTHKWILTVIDTFSRFAFAVPVRTKSGDDVSTALERLLTESKRQPDAIVTDDGKEFFNNRCDNLFKSRNIAHYSTSSVFKASTVERFNRTLKTHLYKHFTKTKNSAWQTILPQLINNYNRRVHRSIGMAPADVNYRNQSQLYAANKLHFHKTTPERYKVGDQVRFATAKMPFAKGYTRTFTSEIFVIARVMKGIIATYQLKDSSGKWVVTGSRKVDDSGKIVKRRATKRLRFYAEELVPAV